MTAPQICDEPKKHQHPQAIIKRGNWCFEMIRIEPYGSLPPLMLMKIGIFKLVQRIP